MYLDRIKELTMRGCTSMMTSEQALRDFVIGGGLIEAMGWEVANGEWQVNVPIYFGSVLHHMDYLVGTGENKFVIEAKNPVNYLDEERDVGELLSYMRQSDTNFGILYNGNELLAFKRGSEIPFYEWSCEDQTDPSPIFEMFSKGNFPEKLENYIKSKGEVNKFEKYVNDNTETIRTRIIDFVSDISGTNKTIVEQFFPFLLNMLSDGENTDQDYAQERNSEIQPISRDQLSQFPEGEVLVCASTGEEDENSGYNWLTKYSAWRAVKIAGNPPYFGLYLGSPYSEIKYFGEIDQIRDALDPELVKMGIPQAGPEDKGKKTILLKPDSIRVFEKPIGLGPSRQGIRNTKYTNIDRLTKSSTVDDL